MPRFFVTLTSMTIVSGQTLENKTDAKATAVTSTGRFQKSEFHRPLSGYVSEERTVKTRPTLAVQPFEAPTAGNRVEPTFAPPTHERHLGQCRPWVFRRTRKAVCRLLAFQSATDHIFKIVAETSQPSLTFFKSPRLCQ